MLTRLLQPVAALAASAALAGCLAYSNAKRDIDTQPVVNTGVGATILMPGQSMAMPAYPSLGQGRPGQAAPGYAPGGAPAPGYGGSSSGSSSGFGAGNQSGSGSGTAYGGSPGAGAGYAAADPGSHIQFIGGADVDEVRHDQFKQEPLPIKVLFAPVAAVAWPFKKLYEAAQGEPKPVPRPQAPGAAPPGPPDAESAYEASQLQALEHQLGQARGAAPAGPDVASAPPPQPQAARPVTRPTSIADELASLQRQVPPRGVAGEGGGAAAAGAAPAGVADKVADRNGDGRPDQWQYRENGVLVRELFDENGDGRVDHTIRYDPATGQKAYEEEDTNGDGVVDSWIEYENGQVARRREDHNGDGQPDVWMLYRGGQLVRVEEDRNGDGFRDRIATYQNGKLHREVEDTNGDGRPDRVTLYDDQERVRERSEDTNGDGIVDARSFYEDGKLVRRELVDEGQLAQPLTEEEQLRTPDAFSDGSEAAPPPRAAGDSR